MNNNKLQTHTREGTRRFGIKRLAGGLKNRGSALGALLALVVGCSVQAGDISGVYKLVTVDGKKLPAVISHEGAALEIRSGAFTIGTNETCGSKMTFVPPTGKEVTLEMGATYTRDGSKLNMQWKGAGRTTGKVEGKTFTMENEDMLLVYEWAAKVGENGPK